MIGPLIETFARVSIRGELMGLKKANLGHFPCTHEWNTVVVQVPTRPTVYVHMSHCFSKSITLFSN